MRDNGQETKIGRVMANRMRAVTKKAEKQTTKSERNVNETNERLNRLVCKSKEDKERSVKCLITGGRLIKRGLDQIKKKPKSRLE